MESFERDFYEERRRKWRRSAFWRGFLVAAVLALLIAGIYLASGAPGYPTGKHIARVNISGTIFDDAKRDALLREIEENEDVAAVILRINSPGGSTTGSEILHENIRKIADIKPTVAVLGEVAASGGYIAAIAADHIVARGNTITGSIGVIMEYPNVSDLLADLGVEMETIRSSELKAGISPFRDPTPASRKAEEAMIDDAYQWFRGLVAERRKLSGAGLDAVSDGRVFTGRMALENGLIDALGGETEALELLESLDAELEQLDVKSWHQPDQRVGIGKLLGQISKNTLLIQRITRSSGPALTSKY